jgi:hypothetical protein
LVQDSDKLKIIVFKTSKRIIENKSSKAHCSSFAWKIKKFVSLQKINNQMNNKINKKLRQMASNVF